MEEIVTISLDNGAVTLVGMAIAGVVSAVLSSKWAKGNRFLKHKYVRNAIQYGTDWAWRNVVKEIKKRNGKLSDAEAEEAMSRAMIMTRQRAAILAVDNEIDIADDGALRVNIEQQIRKNKGEVARYKAIKNFEQYGAITPPLAPRDTSHIPEDMRSNSTEN